IIEKARSLLGPDPVPGALKQKVGEVSKEFHAMYERELLALGVQKPTREPLATAHIPEMQSLIQRLIEKKYAYVSEGDVYFDVRSFKPYGELSGQRLEAMMEGVRIDPNEKKRYPLDFALWKKAKEDEPSWESPWGPGRPGWHIECSAMSLTYLGEEFDIHGGGRDLIFPHHENEIAQSQAATGKPFARFWLHHGLVTTGGQKMSKSLKNFVTLKSVSEMRDGPERLKFLFLGSHYRAPVDYSADRMQMEKSIREKFLFFFEELKTLKSGALSKKNLVAPFEASFTEAMDDDFNTPQAMAVMHEAMHEARKSADPALKVAVGQFLRKVFEWFLLEIPSGAGESSVSLAELERLIREREDAKRAKDFQKADEIRENLLARDIALTDLPDGKTSWRKI
ncbi:MAG: cysteine--tRNA ligase, partial [Candidatus Omnitrophica bacterium]|nr:cysteine--tRNA ligase [Candidatus Omnitrophota bacterium]